MRAPSALAPCLALIAGACAAPPPDPPELALLELTPIANPAVGDHVLVLGRPHSTEPRITAAALDLDQPLPATSGTVAADGSFLLEVPGFDGDRLRIWVEQDGRRSTYVDVVAAFGPAAAVPAPLACLHVPLGVDAGAPITIENECEDEVLIDALVLRTPAPLAIDGATPLTIAAGESASLAVSRTGNEPVDAVLLVTIAAPVADGRAVSIVAP